MSDRLWLAAYLVLLIGPWGVLEGSAILIHHGKLKHPTMSRTIAHLEQKEGVPLRVGIVSVIAIVSTLLTLHLGFQAI